MNRLLKIWNLIVDFIDLVTTLDPAFKGPRSMKVFGVPHFKGGPSTKLAQLEPLLAARGQPYSTIHCFSAVYVPILALKFLKMRGARILVNQNGVAYPAWQPQGYVARNRWLYHLSQIADHVFFQSEFAKKSFNEWVIEKNGGMFPKKFSLLYNAVDLQKFRPVTAVKTAKRDLSNNPVVVGGKAPLRVLIFSDVSTFSQRLWEHVLGLMEFMKDAHLSSHEIRWVFLGRILNREVCANLGLEQMRHGQGVEMRLNTPDESVPDILRSCDVALHLVYNDVCPNKVLECLASGVPVIAGTSGGTPELIGSTGLLLNVEQGYGPHAFPDYEEIRSAFLKLIPTLPEHKSAARERAQAFDLSTWHKRLHA